MNEDLLTGIRDEQDKLDRCCWPDLQPPYNEALRQAVGFILGYVTDVVGIVACGSILRGSPSTASDLDIYVLRQKHERQRVQRRFNGVPAEIFINPPAQAEKYIVQECRAGRPITAHMLATGHVVLELDDTLSRLKHLAQDALSARPAPTPEELTIARYMAASRFEDATDIWETRPAAARMILNMAIHDMLRFVYQKANRFFPRDKDLFIALEDLNPHLSDLVQRFYSESSPDRAIEIAHQIADHTIETFGFFEWESTPETITIAGEEL